MAMLENNRVVLAIEDNELNLMSLKTVFQMENFRVLEAKDIESGVRMIRRYKPDIILIDRELGGTDLGSAVQLIRKDAAFLKIPILAFTTKETSGNNDKTLKMAINGFVSKPILSRSFLEDVKRHMMNHQKTEDPPPLKSQELPPKPDIKLKILMGDPPPNPSIFDGLSGLFTQGYIQKTMELEMKRALRHGYSVGFIKLDVDDFKKFNEKHGRWLGDLMLRETGEVIRLSIREIDVAGRCENDEFAVALPYADKEGTMRVAQRILSTLQSHQYSPGISILINKISVCMGIAICPLDAQSPQEVLSRADQRLQKAKAMGQNQYCAQD